MARDPDTSAGERFSLQDAQLQRLHRVTAALAAAENPRQVAEACLAHGLDTLHAPNGMVVVKAENDPETLVVLAARGYPDEFVERWRRFAISAELPVARSVRTAETVIVRDRSDRAARFPPIADEPAASEALLSAPLMGPERAFGGLLIGYRRSRDLSAAEADFAVVLASLCSLALQRVALLSSERRARVEAVRAASELALLERATHAALTSRSLDRLLGELLSQTAAILRCDAVTVLLVDERQRMLEARAAHGIAGDARSLRIPIGGGFAGRVAATQRSERIDDVRGTRDAVARDELADPEARSLLGVPLVVGGETIGVLQAASRRPAHFSQTDERLLELIAERVAFAIDHARLEERDHELTRSLQAGLLPLASPSRARGLRVMHRYYPAERGLLLAGDFYGVLDADAGGVALLIGDVAGHGSNAAAIATHLRATWRALVLAGVDGRTLIRVLDETMRAEARRHRNDELFATVCCASVDQLRGRAQVLLAGHPAPFVITAGRAEPLAGETHPPLGLVDAATIRWSEHALPADEWSLFLYTDGLIEASRRRSNHDGRARLAAQLAARGHIVDAAQLDELLAAMTAGRSELEDDVVLLAVHRAPP